MKNIIKKYSVVTTLILICFVLAIVTSFYGKMYDLFSFHSNPTYIWQYISGTLMHGSKEAPIWFLWVHFILNCLMIIPFGSILKNKLGLKNTFIY